VIREGHRALIEAFLENPEPLSPTRAAHYQLLRLATGRELQEAEIHSVCDFIDERHDCADFALHGLLRLLYQFPDAASPDLVSRIRATVLGFKYWPDEPGLDSLCTWTENHTILYAAGAYLAGQLFPDEVFTNAGHTGREKRAIARPRIMRWLDLRFRTGFSEWLSNVYYDEDFVALLSLVDFCEDEELAQRAMMVLDLMLLDVALNSFQGLFAGSHGRSYEEQKKWAARDNVAAASRLLFGVGAFAPRRNLSAPSVALTTRYRLPRVLQEVARDPSPMLNRQRMGIEIAEAERFDLGFESFEDGMVFLSMEAYLHPRTAALTLRMMDAFNWWQNNFLKDFGENRRLLLTLRRLGLLRAGMRLVEKDVSRNMRGVPNIITYRTPAYMLSSAVDHRAGFGSDQHHIWQATLGPDAVCFTAHPAKREGPTPDYWTGEGTLPRVAQVKNVLIAVYKINTRPGPYITHRLLFTHAWLPKDKFDEVIERDGWLFARKGEGYLALRSRNPYHWQTEVGPDQDREILAPGRTNVWICELGSREESGGFSDFVEAIREAPLRFRGLRVDYASPSQGRLQFGWRGPFRQNGRGVSLRDFPRYDNVTAQAPYPAERVEVRRAEEWLTLDWQSGERRVSRFVGRDHISTLGLTAPLS